MTTSHHSILHALLLVVAVCFTAGRGASPLGGGAGEPLDGSAAITRHTSQAADRAASTEQDAVLAQRVAPIVVFVVRHAEKGDDDPSDPGLSEVGAARAAELARVLGRAGVTHLFASEYRRTQETLAALSSAAGVQVEVISARDPGSQSARLRELEPGSVAVVCGHSNTVPGLVGWLEGNGRDPGAPSSRQDLGESEYDRIYQVVLPPAPMAEGAFALEPKVLELRYGRSN